jgi:predicted dehydrogenase
MGFAPPPDRRGFLRTAGVLSLSAAGYAATPGANDRLRVGLVGCGGRGQAHLHRLLARPDVAVVGVCDVWDGLEDEYEVVVNGRAVRRRYRQGLYPAATQAGLDAGDSGRVTKDYRRLLDAADVDAVVVATPDHWHARMVLDALSAGKDVLVEPPLARTAAEARAVVEAAERSDRVLAVAAQALADPNWRLARDRIAAGELGRVSHLSAGVFRADPRGYGRFVRLARQMTPRTVDWQLFLGPAVPARPFDRAAFAQWRCDAAFGGGPLVDLLVQPLTRLLAATGLREPVRVMAAGGLFAEQDGRDVPDAVTLLADFAEGCHLVVTGSTLGGSPHPEAVRGRRATLELVKGGVRLLGDGPPREVADVPPPDETAVVLDDFVKAVRRRDRAGVLCPPNLGAAAAVILADGLAHVRAEPRPAADTGLSPPDWQRLAGPWDAD